MPINSDAANDLAGTEAPRAHIHGLRSAIDDDMYPLYVGRPAALGPTLRVAYQITGHDTLVADFTKLTHPSPPPLQKSNGTILPQTFAKCKDFLG